MMIGQVSTGPERLAYNQEQWNKVEPTKMKILSEAYFKSQDEDHETENDPESGCMKVNSQALFIQVKA
jgi:hypothetical protein